MIRIRAEVRRWKDLKLRIPGYIKAIGLFNMARVRHNRELEYLLNLSELKTREADFRDLSIFELVCFN